MISVPLGIACRLAALAYTEVHEDVIAAELLEVFDMHLVACLHDDRTDTHGFIATSETMGAVVVFRGTASLTDGLIDADALLVEPSFWRIGCPMRVHRGFHDAFIGVRDQILKQRDTLEAMPITTIGHSLGGAIASLCALDLALSYGAIVHGHAVRSVTFGSPRVGNREFTHVYDGLVTETVRVVHDADLVPTVPSIDYEHVAGLLHLTDAGTVVPMLQGWWRKFIGFERQALDDLDLHALHDHYLNGYQDVVSLYLSTKNGTP